MPFADYLSWPHAGLFFVALPWLCASHVLAEERWSDEPPACDPIESQCEMRWGVVIEAALALSRENSAINPRGGVRFNFPLTDYVEARTDFLLGGFPGFQDPDTLVGHSSFGALARVSLQLDVGSVYTLSIGADLALALSGGLAGVHLSFLGFRFGPKREFFINLPQQLWFDIQSSTPALEQLLSVSYLSDL
ncbi:MAG TPA: hypothetical protein VMF89_22485 [Polyangiales bacterium]|nr:hypothetical protein [Polyangiales bacterium]